ncbi:MAG: flavodoxin domain-containing protein [Bacteroidota bacterium]|nr:flavodoxin domain-containing protein [Bacteroidota bacterium]
MLAGPKQKILTDLVSSVSKEELIWINGFISGILNNDSASQELPLVNTGTKKITLVYGTETGNAKKLATDLAVKAKKQQIQVKLSSLDQYRLTDLTKEENLFVVISTQGDGEPPIAAQKFYDHIHHNGFRLDHLKYSVLALGDTSYPMFCKTGEDVDAQLHKLGGTRLVPVKKCDVEYEADADAWFQEVILSLQETRPQVLPVKQPVTTGGKSNKIIYTGTVVQHVNLHDRGSEKETYHIELEAPSVEYEPGDSIGIVPENPGYLVMELLSLTKAEGSKQYHYKDANYPLTELLQKKLSLVYLHERVVKKYAALVNQSIPEVKSDLINLLQQYPLSDGIGWEELIQILPAQSPRIYTIASSPTAQEGEIHLTVEKDRFVVEGITKTGLCSDYLSELKTDASIHFFVQKNKRFRLSAPEKDMIMIGPGTGIAAFRSFLFERDATGATGKNWLFFGEDHFVSDFFYQTEIQDWVQTGVLQKISLAFAKDNHPNPLVQDAIIREGKTLFQWLQSGASLYLCGQKTPMSVEVEKALLAVFEKEGNLTPEAALDYFEELKTAGRYSKDVY